MTLPSSSIHLFGVRIDNVDMTEALEVVWSWLQGDRPRYAVTPNVDHFMRLRKDSEFREIYRNASLVIADGMPLVWASKLMGNPLKERVAGSDLFPLLCERTAREGRGVYFLGSMPGVAERAGESLAGKFPGFRLSGCYSPPFGFENDEDENQRIVKKINDSGADILFVALGAPKQEKWTFRHISRLKVKAVLCVGASIDFEAGVIQRAPEWISSLGIEWLWRLLQDPKRLWKRYLLEDMPFLGILIRKVYKRSRKK